MPAKSDAAAPAADPPTTTLEAVHVHDGLWPALLAAQTAVESAPRDGRNAHQNYDFTSAESIMREARARLHPHGLVLLFSESAPMQVRETARYDQQTGAVKGHTTYATCTLTGELVHASSGEKHAFQVSGEGADTGDKAVPKSYTNAVKYGLRHLLLIPFGDDPENDSPTTRQPTQRGVGGSGGPGKASDAQARMLYAKAKAAGLSDKGREGCLYRIAGVTSEQDVPKGKVDAVVAEIARVEAIRDQVQAGAQQEASAAPEPAPAPPPASSPPAGPLPASDDDIPF